MVKAFRLFRLRGIVRDEEQDEVALLCRFVGNTLIIRAIKRSNPRYVSDLQILIPIGANIACCALPAKTDGRTISMDKNLHQCGFARHRSAEKGNGEHILDQNADLLSHLHRNRTKIRLNR